MNSLEAAYEVGVKLAMQEAGIIKQSDSNFFGGGDEGGSVLWPALLGGIGGAIAAPEGKGWQGFGGALGGSAVGSVGGAAAGGGLAALLALLARKSPRAWALPSAMLGSLGGHTVGAIKGYRMATGTGEG